MENLADQLKNYRAFKENFGSLYIVKSPYDKQYYVYKTEKDSKLDDTYIYYADSLEGLNQWLYGAVMANNGRFKNLKNESKLNEDDQLEKDYNMSVNTDYVLNSNLIWEDGGDLSIGSGLATLENLHEVSNQSGTKIDKKVTSYLQNHPTNLFVVNGQLGDNLKITLLGDTSGKPVKLQDLQTTFSGLIENKKIKNEDLTQSIYDELSRVLTDYENGNSDSDDLYNILVKIQNRWEDTITAVTESKIKKEDYTQAGCVGAIKVDIMKPKANKQPKEKKNKKDPALDGLPAQNVIIENKKEDKEIKVENENNKGYSIRGYKGTYTDYEVTIKLKDGSIEKEILPVWDSEIPEVYIEDTYSNMAGMEDCEILDFKPVYEKSKKIKTESVGDKYSQYQAILDNLNLSRDDEAGGLINVDEVTADDIEIVERVAPDFIKLNMKANGMPTQEDIINFIKDNPQFRGEVYLAVPDRGDYRFEIVGIKASNTEENVKILDAFLVNTEMETEPEEYGVYGKDIRAWWD